MKKNNEAGYTGSMALLYSMCLVAWTLYLKFWQIFATLSDKYTEQFGEDALAALAAAKLLPDVNQRRGNTGSVSNKLRETSAKALFTWKKLHRLIIKSYPLADQEAAFLQAGGAYYAKAARRNYGDLSLLMVAGGEFITKNTAALQQGGMAAAFAATYAAATAAFEAEFVLYVKARGTATDGTTDKVNANNALHAAMLEMLADAKILFEEDKTISKQFTYKAIRNMITKDVSCGLHIVVRDEDTKKPLSKAVITISTKDEPFLVNKRGVLDIKLDKGTYTIIVNVPGYTPYLGQATADTGVMHRVAISLKKVAADAVAIA
jgi:hypothetical protein